MGAQKADAARPNHDPGARPDESPVRQATLSPFFLSKYEMTQGQWLRFTGRNPSSYQPGALVKSLLHPVEQVSWNTCRDVCRRLDLALPSEAQWEYAVRAGTASVWWTGNERESLRGAVNIADRSGARAGGDWPDVAEWPDLDDGHGVHAPVNTLWANPFGLHHMLGNVWEWCQDGYDLYQQPVPRDAVWEPKGSPDRVARGGSFALGVAFLRSAYRSHDPPDVSGSTLGLRPARRITP